MKSDICRKFRWIFFWASNKHSAAPGLSLHGGLTTTLDLAHPGHRADCMSSFSQKEAEISILSDVNEISTHRPTLTSMPSRLKLQSSTRIGPLSLGRNRYQCRSSERSGNCGPGTAPYRFQAVRPTRGNRGRCGIPCLPVRWVGNRSSDRSERWIPALKRVMCTIGNRSAAVIIYRPASLSLSAMRASSGVEDACILRIT